MDRLSSGTLPIIEYGGGQAIRLYAMWTIFSTLRPSPPLVSTAPSACQPVSISACQLVVLRLSDGDGWLLSLAVKIRDLMFGKGGKRRW